MRILFLIMVIFAVGFGYQYFNNRYMNRSLHRKAGREVVMQDIYVERAKENYLLLDRSLDLLKEIYATDSIMPVLTTKQKGEIELLVNEFNKNQLPKGKK